MSPSDGEDTARLHAMDVAVADVAVLHGNDHFHQGMAVGLFELGHGRRRGNRCVREAGTKKQEEGKESCCPEEDQGYPADRSSREGQAPSLGRTCGL